MLEHKDYLSSLNKARRKRNQKWDPRYLLFALGALLLIAVVVLVVRAAVLGFSGREAASPGADDARTASPAQAGEGQPGVSAEEAAAQAAQAEKEREIQAVVDSYSNLGIVQVSGYLNIREEPSMDGTIIGKLSGDGACEILDTEGEWSHITSGGCRKTTCW